MLESSGARGEQTADGQAEQPDAGGVHLRAGEQPVEHGRDDVLPVWPE